MTPEAVAESVDADLLVELLQQAIAIPSVTPHEGDFARWVHDQLDDNVWDHKALAPFDDTRANVYAGVGHGHPSLVLAGHLDTVHADDWTKHWAGTERADPFAASIIDREIWGRGYRQGSRHRDERRPVKVSAAARDGNRQHDGRRLPVTGRSISSWRDQL